MTDLQLAALDPEAAIAAASSPDLRPRADERQMIPVVRVPGLTMAVEVDPPPAHSRWRFLVFWLLLRLACRVYPFKFEIYRTPDPD